MIGAGLLVAREAKAVAAEHRARMHDDAISQSGLCVDGHTRNQLARLADLDIIEQHTARPDPRPGADADVFADDRVGTNRHVRTNLRAWIDDRGGMNAQNPISEPCTSMVRNSASVATLPSTIARPFIFHSGRCLCSSSTSRRS